MQEKPAAAAPPPDTGRCLVCLAPLDRQSDIGRPADYCGAACRREREHARARCRRRIERLEEERMRYLRLLDTRAEGTIKCPQLGVNLTPKRALTNVEKAIARESARLLALADPAHPTEDPAP